MRDRRLRQQHTGRALRRGGRAPVQEAAGEDVGAGAAGAVAGPVAEHRRIAPGGRGRIGLADEAAQADGHVDDLLDVRAPLPLVGVEQVLAGGPRQHQVELPGQVRRVPDARAHPLAGEGGHLVGGVAREEDPAAAPAPGVAAREGVDGVAFHGGVPVVHAEQGQQPPGVLGSAELRGRLVGQPHELPAAVPRAGGDRHPGPRRVGDLEVERGEVLRPVRHHVAGHPVQGEPGVVEPRPQALFADEAVGAVAAHHPAGRQRPVLTGPDVLGDELHHPAALGDAHGPVSAQHPQLRQPGGAPGERLLQPRLVHGGGVRPAVRALGGQ